MNGCVGQFVFQSSIGIRVMVVSVKVDELVLFCFFL